MKIIDKNKGDSKEDDFSVGDLIAPKFTGGNSDCLYLLGKKKGNLFCPKPKIGGSFYILFKVGSDGILSTGDFYVLPNNLEVLKERYRLVCKKEDLELYYRDRRR